ncbi:hypothetical protein V1514DRAFT_218601 [Lipomyces japonicus]|uniref:uncharacterized protein n=1 Tax=Lipomyces japonicus TaxID=56871 RepID=UPI0034CE783E
MVTPTEVFAGLGIAGIVYCVYSMVSFDGVDDRPAQLAKASTEMKKAEFEIKQGKVAQQSESLQIQQHGSSRSKRKQHRKRSSIAERKASKGDEVTQQHDENNKPEVLPEQNQARASNESESDDDREYKDEAAADDSVADMLEQDNSRKNTIRVLRIVGTAPEKQTAWQKKSAGKSSSSSAPADPPLTKKQRQNQKKYQKAKDARQAVSDEQQKKLQEFKSQKARELANQAEIKQRVAHNVWQERQASTTKTARLPSVVPSQSFVKNQATDENSGWERVPDNLGIDAQWESVPIKKGKKPQQTSLSASTSRPFITDSRFTEDVLVWDE